MNQPAQAADVHSLLARRRWPVAFALLLAGMAVQAQVPRASGQPVEPAPATATAAPEPVPKALVQAVRQAVHANPEVQSRWNALQAARAGIDVLSAAARPQVDLTANGGLENSANPTDDLGSYGTVASRLVFRQMLYDGGLHASEVRRQGHERQARLFELKEISESVALEAFRAYVDVLRMRDLVEVATDNHREHERVHRQVATRTASGVGRRVDLEQATGRLALARSNLLTELTNLHDVSARFQRVVGEAPAEPLPRLPADLRLPGQPASLQTLFDQGLSRNAAILAAAQNVRAMNQAVASRRLEDKPKVELRAYQSLGRNTSGTLGNNRAHGVEAVLNLSLFDGGAREAGTRQTAFERDRARDLQTKVCRETRQTLTVAFSDAASKQQQMRNRDEHRRTTERSREAYRQQFDIGQRSLLDLLDSQNEHFEATRAFIHTSYDKAIAQARTLAAMGTLAASLGAAREDLVEAANQDAVVVDATSDELCPAERVAGVAGAGGMPPSPEAGGATPSPSDREGVKPTLPALANTAQAGGRSDGAVPVVPTRPGPSRDLTDRTFAAAAIAPAAPATMTPPLPWRAAPSETQGAIASKTPVQRKTGVASKPARQAAATDGTKMKVAWTPEPGLSDARAVRQPRAGSTEDEVWNSVQLWARTWVKRDMKAHLESYSPDFKGQEPTRAAWRRARAETIRSAPTTVLVSDPIVRAQGDRAQVRFNQTIVRDGKVRVLSRSMHLQRLDGRWKIVIESEPRSS